MILDHIGIAVKDMEKAIELYRDVLGLTLARTVKVESERVEIAFLPAGDAKIELLKGTDEESPISKFINKRGEGIHHLAFKVENIEKALETLKEKGVRLIDEKPKVGDKGKIAFIHPSSTRGVLIELMEVVKVDVLENLLEIFPKDILK